MNTSINKSKTVNFADVAHGTLIFDKGDKNESLILELIDTKWVQRLRRISQTGNTKFVYMFAEHSRFGHSLGVAFLASTILKHLSHQRQNEIELYGEAIVAAAILHDVGHLAPGSHLAENVWSRKSGIFRHELLTQKIIEQDPEISQILSKRDPNLCSMVNRILAEDPSLPSWTTSLISGGGWNVDRGNWSIVDSVMCAVTYGRYNVTALIDAFRLTDAGQLVIQESRVDALSHFFVARNSMYRQVYQHRVLQTADSMTKILVERLRESDKELSFRDEIMDKMLYSESYQDNLSLEELFQIDESWWNYHLAHWCYSSDDIVKNLALRLRDRKFLKTINLSLNKSGGLSKDSLAVVEQAKKECLALDLDPNYYCLLIQEKDKHLGKSETPPKVLREDGSLIDAVDVEPLIAILSEKSKATKAWLAVPKEVKLSLGKNR